MSNSMDALTYWTVDGDRWDLLAWMHYGDPLRYEEIRRANPTLSGPTLSSGIPLTIPILDPAPIVASGSLPPWRA